jgi:hypothetical protein
VQTHAVTGFKIGLSFPTIKDHSVGIDFACDLPLRPIVPELTRSHGGADGMVGSKNRGVQWFIDLAG